jgi:hypothetical protein
MVPHDELKYGGTEYVLASPGYAYIIYASEKSEKLGLRNMVGGTYDMRWYDCVTGKSIQQNHTEISSGQQSWKKPGELGDEVALYISRTDGKARPGPSPAKEQETGTLENKAGTTSDLPNTIPVAPDKSIATKKDTPVDIQLTYNDPDGGPGPYTTTIVIHPSYGRLSGTGNDQTYTPLAGYTGSDTITWKVNDGADDSKIATLQIIITP